jgi:hypothetical protein
LKLQSTRLSVQKSIQRLEQKQILFRIEFRPGRGGWTVYELPESTWNQILQTETSDKLRTNLGQTSDKPKTEPRTEPRTSPPCSSSNLELINTTTTDPTKTVSEADSFWLAVPKNLDGLVSVKQLREFVRQGLIAADDLQTSLDGFAFDLEKGAVRAKNGNPVAILIGAIKGGGYISQQYLSELKASLAEVANAREELARLEAESAAEILREEFENFRAKHPDQAEAMKEPASKFVNNFQPGSVGYKLWLEEYKRQRGGMQEASRSVFSS